MKRHDISRRAALKGGGAAFAGFTALRVAGPAQAFSDQSQSQAAADGVASDDAISKSDPTQTLGQAGDQVIPWLDQPPPSPIPDAVGNILVWEQLNSWLTPPDNFFFVRHYDVPANLDEATWHVDIGGLVASPQSLSIANVKARPRHEVDFTLECSGNNGPGLDFFTGGVGNARWAGARLAPLLEDAGILEGATEVIFWGADKGPVTIRDNSGIISAGQTGTGQPDGEGGIDLSITEQFARSMSIRDALSRDNLLCYAMNDQPLPPEHGFPLRLIAPGWYGVANVKWLTRIEVVSQRWAGRFMARDYVTIREEQRAGETTWTFATVSHERLKSAPARVVRRDGGYVILGVTWGAPIAAVDVRVDDGPWFAAHLFGPSSNRRNGRGFAWRFWRINWPTASPGEHTITSRAFDTDGRVQPPPDDPFLASKRTYWESNGQITRHVLIP